MRIGQADLTAAARIRNAAIACFAREGFDVGLRQIAEDAGVSLGLIRHHYGAKEGLRAACDAHVLDLIVTQQTERMKATDMGAAVLDQLARSPEWATEMQYLVRSLNSGTEMGRTVFDTLVDSTRKRLAYGVAHGIIAPSADEHARAYYLTITALGGLVLAFNLGAGRDATEIWNTYVETTALPTLEVYTTATVIDTTALDAYRAYLAEASEGPSTPPMTPKRGEQP